MAINLEAIRKRIGEMSGQGRVQLWKPAQGKHKIRVVPWKNSADGMPFLERRYYYIGDAPRFLAPVQFGKPDPVNDLIKKCYASGKPEDRELAKLLHSKMAAYMALIDRADVEKGVQVWGFNSFVYQQLLAIFDEEGVGDYTDPENGFDLIVTISPSKRMFKGKPVMDMVPKASRTQTKLSDDPAQVAKWLEGQPNIDDLYPQKTTVEIEQILNTWLASGATVKASAGDDEGTERGSGKASVDVLDKIAEDVKSAVKPAARRVTKPKTDVDVDGEDSTTTAPKQTLDDAFDEIMKDEAEA